MGRQPCPPDHLLTMAVRSETSTVYTLGATNSLSGTRMERLSSATGPPPHPSMPALALRLGLLVALLHANNGLTALRCAPWP